MLRRMMLASGSGGVTDPYWANVVSLLHFDGTDGATTTTDQKGRTWTFRTSAQIDTAQAAFGPSSLLIGGSSTSRIDCASSSDFGYGLADFTIEGWFRVTAVTAGLFNFLYDGRVDTSSAARPTIYIFGPQLRYFVSGADRVTGGTVTVNTWHHWAYARVSGTGRLFLDGISVGSWSDGQNYSTHPVTLGNSGHTPYSSPLFGWQDEFRVTKGVGRYTSGFTPTGPFPNS